MSLQLGCGVAALLLALATAAVSAPKGFVFDAGALQYGPPASPLSWKQIETTHSGTTLPSHQAILGASNEYLGSAEVAFHDERPYGDVERRTVWLERYTRVRVETHDGRCASVTLSMAFDASTQELVCAFTDPAPAWLLSPTSSREIEQRSTHNYECSPARGDLRSTVTGVLGALWESYGHDPNKAGQIVIRPRFVINNNLAWNAITKERIVYPQENIWIVEVLGTVVLEKDFVATVLVAQFADDGLKMLVGEILP